MDSYEVLFNIFKERFAAKEFDGREIEESEINKILEAIRLAPSSYNLQPWKIIVVKNRELKEKLYPLSYNQKQILTASHILVFCANLNKDEILNNYEEMSKEKGEERVRRRVEYLRNYLDSLTKEELIHYTQLQVYIIATYSLLISKSLGIDSCPMGGFDPKGYSKVLNLDEDTLPTLVVPLGYASGKKKKERFPLEKVVKKYY